MSVALFDLLWLERVKLPIKRDFDCVWERQSFSCVNSLCKHISDSLKHDFFFFFFENVSTSSFCGFILMPLLLSSTWSSRHWSPCRRLWRLCRHSQLILPVFLPLLLSHRCRQQSGDWWLFCLQCWQCLSDLLRRLSWSFPEIYWRGSVRVDIPVGLQLLFGTSLLYCRWRGLHCWAY